MPTPLRFTRWTNPSLPQTLQYSVILLYVEAVFGLLWLVGFGGIGGSAYLFAGWFLPNSARSLTGSSGIVSLMVLVSCAAYAFGGAAIANEQRRGWLVGLVVAGGAVILPLVTYGPGILLTSYVITYLFDVALVALLAHPMSRSYQKIWFR